MAAIDEWIVREYFELNGFYTRQWRGDFPAQRTKKSGERVNLTVLNPHWQEGSPPPQQLLFGSELERIGRAVVAIRLWQIPRNSPGTARASAEVLKFLQGEVLRRADDLFPITDAGRDEQTMPCLKILVLPALPTHEPSRSEAVKLLNAHGIDCLLSFRSLLQDVISRIDLQHGYQNTDLLQILRVLKNYDMLKSPQLELFGDGK